MNSIKVKDSIPLIVFQSKFMKKAGYSKSLIQVKALYQTNAIQSIVQNFNETSSVKARPNHSFTIRNMFNKAEISSKTFVNSPPKCSRVFVHRESFSRSIS